MFLICLLLPSHSDAASMNVELFRPTTDNGPYITTHSTRTLGKFKYSLGLTFDVAHRPIELAGPGGTRIAGVVDDLFMMHLTAGFGIIDMLQVGIDIPVAPINRVVSSTTGDRQLKMNMSDIRFELKVKALDPDRYGWGVAVVPFALFPTGSGDNLTGNDSFAGGGKLALESPDFAGRVRFALNVGYEMRERASVFGTIVDDSLLYSLAANIHVNEFFEVIPEIYGRSVMNNLFGSEAQSPAEVSGSARVYFAEKFSIDFAGAAAIVNGVGAPLWRAMVRFAYKPLLASKDRSYTRKTKIIKPTKKEIEEVTQEEVYDLSKECPDPEAFDPDIHDHSCPKVYVLREIASECPEPELFDEEIHDPSCPKVYVLQTFDADNDGVPDFSDRCPDNAGPVENDGCPTYGRSRIDWAEGRIKSDKILFKFGQYGLITHAKQVLDQVAGLLVPHMGSIQKIIVEGHTDSVGLREYNQRLSERRAVAVRDYLVAKGIDRRKMTTIGYGQRKPVASNRTEEGQIQNRRVTFQVKFKQGYAPVDLVPAAVDSSKETEEDDPLGEVVVPEETVVEEVEVEEPKRRRGRASWLQKKKSRRKKASKPQETVDVAPVEPASEPIVEPATTEVAPIEPTVDVAPIEPAPVAEPQATPEPVQPSEPSTLEVTEPTPEPAAKKGGRASWSRKKKTRRQSAPVSESKPAASTVEVTPIEPEPTPVPDPVPAPEPVEVTEPAPEPTVKKGGRSSWMQQKKSRRKKTNSAKSSEPSVTESVEVTPEPFTVTDPGPVASEPAADPVVDYSSPPEPTPAPPPPPEDPYMDDLYGD